MKSGYKIQWTDRAILDLKNIIDFLLSNWTEHEIKKFVKKLDSRLQLISVSPKIFPKSNRKKNIRRSVLTKHTVIYYETSDVNIRILTLFDPRQSPKKLRI